MTEKEYVDKGGFVHDAPANELVFGVDEPSDPSELDDPHVRHGDQGGYVTRGTQALFGDPTEPLETYREDTALWPEQLKDVDPNQVLGEAELDADTIARIKSIYGDND